MRRLNVLLTAAIALPAVSWAQQDPPELLGPAPRIPGLGDAPAKHAVPLKQGNWDRTAVVALYNDEYLASEGVADDWTGDTATCTPGTLAAAYQEATIRRVNYYRTMAGVYDAVVLDAALDGRSQQCALMMLAEGSLSHFPGTGWSCYTADGAQAAGKSNLSLGNAGPAAVMSQMRDNGAGNTAAGHRRWILFPRQRVMGSGSCTGFAKFYWGSNCLYVLDSGTWSGSDGQSAWPPEGYAPRQVVYPRWSFSYPSADFSNATVAMTGPGGALSVTKHAPANGYGTNTVVWEPQGVTFPYDEPDIAYRVTIDNVGVAGTPTTFSYDVVIIDPAYTPPAEGEGEGEGELVEVWVDFDYTGVEDGSFDQPYNTLAEAVLRAGVGATVKIKTGETSETIVIDQALYLEASGGPVRIGAP